VKERALHFPSPLADQGNLFAFFFLGGMSRVLRVAFEIDLFRD
jgi:hypothetical protein